MSATTHAGPTRHEILKAEAAVVPHAAATEKDQLFSRRLDQDGARRSSAV